MPITFPEFKSRCQFYVQGDKLHGVVRVRMPNGRIVEFRTRPHEGIDLSLLTSKILRKQQGTEVGGFFSSAWKKAKNTAKAVASNSVTKTLYNTTQTALKNPIVRQALAQVPGGNQAMLGLKAASLLEKAINHKDPKAKQQIRKIHRLARQGHPNAQRTLAILQAVHQAGKQKNAWVRQGRRYVRPPARGGVPRGWQWPVAGGYEEVGSSFRHRDFYRMGLGR